MNAGLNGKVVRLEDNGCTAVVETRRGEAYVDVNFDFPLRISVGDMIELDTESYYTSDGIFVYAITEKSFIAVNGWIPTWKQQGGGA